MVFKDQLIAFSEYLYTSWVDQVYQSDNVSET